MLRDFILWLAKLRLQITSASHEVGHLMLANFKYLAVVAILRCFVMLQTLPNSHCQLGRRKDLVTVKSNLGDGKTRALFDEKHYRPGVFILENFDRSIQITVRFE